MFRICDEDQPVRPQEKKKEATIRMTVVLRRGVRKHWGGSYHCITETFQKLTLNFLPSDKILDKKTHKICFLSTVELLGTNKGKISGIYSIFENYVIHL